MKRLSCAFTGHRPQKLPWRYNEMAESCTRLKKTLAMQIARLVAGGVTDFLTGMAQGVDTFCAEIVLDLREKNPGLKLHCARFDP